MTLTIIDVYMDSCAPCKALSPIIDQLQQENPEVTFKKVNAHSSEGAQLSGKYAIRSVPTLLFIDSDGNRLAPDNIGMVAKTELQNKINNIMGAK